MPYFEVTAAGFNGDIDYTLPKQALAFTEALLTWASVERNKNRA